MKQYKIQNREQISACMYDRDQVIKRKGLQQTHWQLNKQNRENNEENLQAITKTVLTECYYTEDFLFVILFW